MRVYVAGPYSAGDTITCLNNMRIGMKASTKVLLAGHQPFCPWIDFHFQLMLEEHESLTVEDYYRYSISWLEVADVMVVLDGWKKSSGTIAEVDRAKEIGIPIFFGVEEFLKNNPVLEDADNYG